MTTYKPGDKVAFRSHPTDWADDPTGTVIDATHDRFGRIAIRLDRSGRTVSHFPGNLLLVRF